MVSTRLACLAAVLALAVPTGASAKDSKIRVEYRSKEISVHNKAKGKKRKFILLKPGEVVRVHVEGPLLVNVKIHDVIDKGSRAGGFFTLTSVRDGAFKAEMQMLLPASADFAFKGLAKQASRQKRRQFEVPLGEHVYELTVSPEARNGIALRFYKGKKPRPREVVNERAMGTATAPPPPKPRPKPKPKPEPAPQDESWVVVGPTSGGAVTQSGMPTGQGPAARPAPGHEEPGGVQTPPLPRPRRKRRGDAGAFGAGVRVEFVVPVSEAELSYGVLLDLRYHLSVLKGDLSLGLLIGYSPFSAKVKQPASADGSLAARSVALEGHTMPLLFGLFYDLPFGLPVEIGIEGGYFMAYAELDADVLTEKLELSGTAQGYFLGGGLEYPLGPGRVGLAARWVGTPSGTGDIGGLDLGGVHVHAGYRFMF